MKGNEIISNLLNNRFNSEIPFTLINSLYGGNFIDDSIENYYKRSELYLKGQSNLYNRLKTDIIYAPFALSLYTTVFGGEIYYFNTQPPSVSRYAIRKNSNIFDIKAPNPKSSKEINYVLECIKLLKENFKNEAPICATLPSPIDLPLLLFGFEEWLNIFLFEPKKRTHIIDITLEFVNNTINEFIDSGADLVAMAVPFSSNYFMTDEIIRTMTSPIYKKYLSQIKIPIVIHHGGQPMFKSLDFLKDVENIAGFYVDSRDSLKQCREKLGNERVLLGNLDGVSLYKISNELLDIKLEMILKNAGTDQKFVFGTSNADIPLSTDINKLKYIRQFIKGYKRGDDKNYSVLNS